MKAKDLRIGNLVECTHPSGVKEISEVVIINGLSGLITHESKGMGYEDYVTSLNPIELNEEWLKRMGFEYFTAAKFWRLKGFIVYYDTENELFWCSISESLVVQLYHVHTLQNAFALTGHELEIK